MGKVSSKFLLHHLEGIVHYLVDNDGEENENKTDQDGENHLVPLPLLDTLLPNIVLQTGLFRAASVSEVDNVCNKSFIDALQ
jgi:hypothetical protein